MSVQKQLMIAEAIVFLEGRIGRYDRRAERVMNGGAPEAIHYQRDDREFDGQLLKIIQLSQ